MSRVFVVLVAAAAAVVAVADRAYANPVVDTITRPSGALASDIGVGRPLSVVPDQVALDRPLTLADSVAAADTGGGGAPTLDGAGACGDYVYCVATCGPAACACDRWQFRASIPIWIPGITGSFATGSTSVSSGGSLFDFAGLADRFLDVATGLEFAFVGSLGASRGRWSLDIDGFGATVGSTLTVKSSGADAEIDLTAFIGRAMVGYRIVDGPLGCGTCGERRLTADVYTGIRVYHVNLELDTGTSDDKGSSDWIDPIIGLRAKWDLSARWTAAAEADIGGFGVGSDFVWSASASIGYRFTSCFGMRLGWSILDIDYSIGSGSKNFEFDVRFSGPTLAFTFEW